MKKDSALNLLIFDLLKNILSLAEKPEELGQYITTQVRELVGSKMVILFRHSGQFEDIDNVIVGICPERKRNSSELKNLREIAILSNTLHTTTIIGHNENGNELEKLFCRMGGKNSIILPLEYSANRIGLLLLIDIIDIQNIETVIDSLNALSGILALELRNAMYNMNLEWQVRERTKELYEVEEIFRNFLLNSPVYVFFKDTGIRSLMLSKNYETMLGKPMKELIGKTMDDLFPSELAKKMVDEDKKILEKGEMMIIEEELNGRYYTTLKFPISIDGVPKYLAGYTIDITDQKITEKALHDKADELERFNNLMLGREMKMIDLKKEINNLLKESGRKEKYKIHE